MYRYIEFLEEVNKPQFKSTFDATRSHVAGLKWEPEGAVWFPGTTKLLNRRQLSKLNNRQSEWLRATISGHFHRVSPTVWLFERRGDAMLFYMRWKGMME